MPKPGGMPRAAAAVLAAALLLAAPLALPRVTARGQAWWLLGAALLNDPGAALTLLTAGQAAVPAQAVPRPGPTPEPTPGPVPEPTPGPSAAPPLPSAAVPEPSAPSPFSTPPASAAVPPGTTPTPAPTAPPGAGRVTALRYSAGAGSVRLAAGSIDNRTDHADSVLAAAASGTGLPFAVAANSAEPQVLILHTHATECYQPWTEPLFDPAFTARTEDRTQNMCAVGERMTQVLLAAGINTLHDTTLHDSPSYTEAYARSAATARRYLERYPSIKVILDVHRDAIESGGARVKPLAQIGGQDTAQVMLIAGCDNGGSVPLPNWKQNLRFAAAWEQSMETLYPGLTRPVLCGYRFYNQDITTGSLLIEVGGHANTLDEALRAGELAARALAELLL